MDHSNTPPPCLQLHLNVPCGHLMIAHAWESVVLECTFVNRSGHPASSTTVFFAEISVVFQKQVLKNKCRNVVPRCLCTLQMVPLSMRIGSSPFYLRFFCHWRTLQRLFSIMSVGQTNKPHSRLCFSPVNAKNNEKTDKLSNLICLHLPDMFVCMFFFSLNIQETIFELITCGSF